MLRMIIPHHGKIAGCLSLRQFNCRMDSDIQYNNETTAAEPNAVFVMSQIQKAPMPQRRVDSG